MSAIAVDFGSSNTVVARWNAIADRPVALKIPEISRPEPLGFLIPSVLYLKDAAKSRALIGQQAIDSPYDPQQPRFFDQIKRRLSVPIGFVPQIDGVRVTPELAGRLFLGQLFDRLQRQQIYPPAAIFTVPVQSYERYLRWLESCRDYMGQNTPVSSVRMLDEPTAAALGYAIDRPGSLVLAIDFGGGTLDLSLVRTPRNDNLSSWGDYVGEANSQDADAKVEIIAKTGQVLGGEDIDRWLVEDCIERLNLDANAPTRLLMTLMERVKIKLSSAESASTVFFDPNSLQGHELVYTRGQLERILQQRGFYRVLQTAIDDVVKRAAAKGILKIDIRHVLLVGGSTAIPSVRESIAKYFGTATVYDDKPFEAVACGALMLDRGMRVRDRLFHSYAIRYWQADVEQWRYQPLFLKGQTYPTQRPYELLLRASQPNQARIELVIGELEKRPAGSAEVVFDGDRLVTTVDESDSEIFLPLIDADTPQAIAELDPLGQPGSDRLKILFSISERRQLLVTAIDLETQKYLLRDRPVADLH